MESAQVGAPDRDERVAKPELVLAPHVALSAAATRGVRLFARRPPVHSVLLGRCHIECQGTLRKIEALALPANMPHRVLALESPYAAVAYLDARRFRFEDAQRLADRWRGFVPGVDDLREACGDALALPRRRVDARVMRALDALEGADLTVSEAARRVGLSDSRLTHLVTDALGAPPRTYRAWFKLQRALGESMFGAKNLTQAAERAGFADSAHLTRTCKQLTGVLPSEMMPGRVYVMGER